MQGILSKEQADPQISKNLLWLLENLASDGPKNRDMIMMIGFNSIIVRYLKSTDQQLQIAASNTLFTISRIRPQPNYSSFMNVMILLAYE